MHFSKDRWQLLPTDVVRVTKAVRPEGTSILARIFKYALIFSILDFCAYIMHSTNVHSELYRSLLSAEAPIEQYNGSDAIIFYRAYLDTRIRPPRVRIYGVSQRAHFKDKVELFIKGINLGVMQRFPLISVSSCKWDPFFLESPHPQNMAPDELTVAINGRKFTVPVIVTPTLEEKILVCVPPVYLYDDWPRLVLFFELWRKETSTFIMYVNSVSNDAKTVLDYYVKQGVLQIVEWPLMPKLAKDDPNDSNFRLVMNLANSDCIMRSNARYVASLDIDEYLFAFNKTLLDYTRDLFSAKPKLASINFQHAYFAVDTLKMDGDFKNIANGSGIEHTKREPKTIYMPERIRAMDVHAVRTFVPGYETLKIPTSEAICLHFRRTAVYFDEKKEKKIRFGNRSPFTEQFSEHLREITRDIFQGNPPPFNSSVADELENCHTRYFKDPKFAKSVGGCFMPLKGECYEIINKKYGWHYYKGNEDSRFIAL